MNKDILIFLVVALVLLAPVYSLDADPRKTGNYLWTPIADYFGSYWGKSYTDKIPGMFYTIEPWELEVCSSRLTSEIKTPAATVYTGTSTDQSNLYAPITATLNAEKSYSGNLTLVEISWYVQPKNTEITYSIYLKKGTSKFYIPNYKNVIADPTQGDAGYYAEYSEINYTDAYIAYSNGDVILSIPIGEK
ncbi:TPA: hypothetical protein HA235_07225 [Candidatus Woesearchaeota archaeon]|nr:hypothetical protein [Candidatus Woesearchaeota archaeon]HIH32468.1 hypothetical protein [Candidatus Woesearchaeota archaeon]HIH54253.1 hypothetical protein [Candidatus Woesearchaeota archaeon]HIJ02591.1 hypothetical protein [Candidatus Woesearchaeota archaeon]HIJ13853.1 hypothetical protein [Candidatus Woesearchaeota archaeon]